MVKNTVSVEADQQMCELNLSEKIVEYVQDFKLSHEILNLSCEILRKWVRLAMPKINAWQLAFDYLLLVDYNASDISMQVCIAINCMLLFHSVVAIQYLHAAISISGPSYKFLYILNPPGKQQPCTVQNIL